MLSIFVPHHRMRAYAIGYGPHPVVVAPADTAPIRWLLYSSPAGPLRPLRGAYHCRSLLKGTDPPLRIIPVAQLLLTLSLVVSHLS